jgi:hypothetical protein
MLYKYSQGLRDRDWVIFKIKKELISGPTQPSFDHRALLKRAIFATTTRRLPLSEPSAWSSGKNIRLSRRCFAVIIIKIPAIARMISRPKFYILARSQSGLLVTLFLFRG